MHDTRAALVSIILSDTPPPSANKQNWLELLASASAHRVHVQLAHAGLRSDSVPPDVRELFNSIVGSAYAQDGARRTAYGKVLAKLAAQGIRPVVMKGFCLSNLAYEQSHERPYSDLDLLVDPASLDRTHKALLELGFIQGEWDNELSVVVPYTTARLDGYREELQHLATYSRLERESNCLLSIDLHFRLSTVFDHQSLDTEEILGAAQEAEHAIPWLRMAPSDMVCHLAYHAWWDTQSIDNIVALTDLRLSHFNDIRLVFQKWQLNCNDVLVRSVRLGSSAATNWALDACSKLFGMLRGGDAIDSSAARTVGDQVSDRWLQRDTAEPLFKWAQPTVDRMFNPSRADEALARVWSDYINPRLRQGDVMRWTTRDEIHGFRN